MAISPLPPAPLPTDTQPDFNAKAFDLVASLDLFVTEANAQALDVEQDALDAEQSKINAEAAAASAIATANVSEWVSGTLYTEGDVVWSPITYLTYRIKTSITSTTDPSADLTNWVQVVGTGNVTIDGTQTLENKTLISPIFTGDIFDNGAVKNNIVAVSGLDINCELGNYFTKTINANSTFTFSNAPTSSSFAFTLEVTHTSGTITWPTEVKWPQDIAPSLATGRTHLFIFVTDDNGTRWRGASLVDYVN
jgi:hypothetical protein